MMTTPTTIMTIIKMYGGNNIHLSKSPSHVVNSKSGYNGVGSYGALRHVRHPSYFFRKAFNYHRRLNCRQRLWSQGLRRFINRIIIIIILQDYGQI